MFRPLFVLLLLFSATLVNATEVASVTACKPEGETWICASWKDAKTAVFRSERYISRVEFKGATDLAALIKVDHADSSATPASRPDSQLENGRYTLQLLACNSAPCIDRMRQLKAIPNSREVELADENSLWRVLLVGSYGSKKSAQKAAAALMGEYKLRDKPWIRTLESVERRELRP